MSSCNSDTSTNPTTDIASPSPLHGAELIKARLKDVPLLPGVYKMLDSSGKIIYIGKAKNLRNRLASYSKPDLLGKVAIMVSKLCDFEYIIVNSEVEALLLEAQLIKTIQPKFNILLKDDKSFPYIKLRLEHDYPQLIKYRGKDTGSGELFGPFASSAQVDATLNELQKIFKLRSCSDHYLASRKRPCLQYQIGRCCAPCVGKINDEDYAELVLEIKDFLSGKTVNLQQKLSRKMEEFSLDMEFEKAAQVRDRIKALTYIQTNSGLAGSGVIDGDVIALSCQNDSYCIQVFLYRAGSVCGNRAYFPLHTENSDENEVLESFLVQFYQNRTPPKEIILSHKLNAPEIISKAIEHLHKTKVTISSPITGPKFKLVENAIANAELALQQHLKNSVKQHAMFAEIQKLFSLPDLPERIEIYDNSHIMGSFAVGIMVVVTEQGFNKKEYRTFNVDNVSEASGDDYAMLQNVLERRFARLLKDESKMPSLLIIDGGKGHLSVAMKTMQQAGLNVPIVCMSKGPDRNAGLEQFHIDGKEPFTIDKNQPVMKYLQIMRDEAHNFAIQTHRSKRSKAIRKSGLDELPGIGEKRKKQLLHHFGSYKAIMEASLEQLMQVPTISKSVALKIKTRTGG